MTAIKALLIDFGDTLAHVDEARNKKYITELWKTLREHGYTESVQRFEEAWGKILHQSSRGTANSFNELWRSLLSELEMREDASLIKKLDPIRKAHSLCIFKLYEGVPQTLRKLRKRYELILVSNCAYGLSENIVQLGLDKFFSKIVLSYQVGARKPDKRIYAKALEKSGLKPDECMFVADEISDLEGAREVGMKTLLVRQGQFTLCEAKDADFQPDLQFREISEIAKLL